MNPLEAIDHRSAWRADSSSADTFTVSLSAKHLDAIDRAVRHVQSLDIEVESITRDQFELPDIREDVAQWRNEVMWGTGIIILDGFPVDSYSKEEMGIVHWGLGTHFGTAMSQSVMGDRLGHVINVGGKDPKERAYRNSLELAMHTDACDVVAMMSLRTAREGGESGYVSAISIYNEVLRRAPELMPVLMDGYFYHRFGEEEPGASPVTEQKIPVFSFEKGYLSVNFLRSYIEMAAEEMQSPLSKQEVAALDLVDDIAHDPDFALHFVTRPGSAVFFNNLTVLHNRTGFEDHEDPDKKRHLLRLWLVAHEPRPVAEAWRIYEGKGIEKQEGRTTGFDRAEELRYHETGARR